MSKLTEMLYKYRSQGTVSAKVGIMGGKTYPDGESVVSVAVANEYGTGSIPARPFFREAVAKNQSVLPQMAASLISRHDPETAVRLMAEHMADELQESVMTWEEPPNAPSTIRQKGYNAPLRGNDRLLRNSFSYEIEE